MKKIEFKFGLFILVIAAFYFVMAGTLPEEAGYYPKFVGMLTLLLTIVNLIQILRSDDREKTSVFSFINWNQLLFILGISLVYIVLIKPVGYFTTTAMYLIIGLIGLKISIKNAILVSLGTGAFMFVVFKSLLGVPLPIGIFY